MISIQKKKDNKEEMTAKVRMKKQKADKMTYSKKKNQQANKKKNSRQLSRGGIGSSEEIREAAETVPRAVTYFGVYDTEIQRRRNSHQVARPVGSATAEPLRTTIL